MSNEYINFIRNLITVNKATFHVKVYVNSHNCRIWESKPSDRVCIKSYSSPKINVYATVTCYSLIGLYFFEEYVVKADHYRKMLKEFLVLNLKRRKLKSSIFQQDGAPPHYAFKVREF